MGCPDGNYGCAFFRWLEPPHGERSVAVIKKILKEMNELKIKHMLERCKIFEKHGNKIKQLKQLVNDVHTDDESEGEGGE
ncbi:hypothetical protein OROMI_023371 [Orobanche minor]